MYFVAVDILACAGLYKLYYNRSITNEVKEILQEEKNYKGISANGIVAIEDNDDNHDWKKAKDVDETGIIDNNGVSPYDSELSQNANI